MGLLARIILALVIFAVAQEVATRAVFPLPEVTGFDRLAYSLVYPDGVPAPRIDLGHASFSWASEPDGFEFVHRLNLYGFRDRDWRLRARDGVARVAFVGDSMVEGFSAEAEDAIPQRFERLAAERGLAVEALNLGVGGGWIPSYTQLIRDAAPLLRPQAVILVLYANDLEFPEFRPEWLDDPIVPEKTHPARPRLAYVLDRLRAGRRVPRRWVSAPFPYLAATPDPRNELSHPATARLVESGATPEMVDAMRRGRLNTGLAGFFPWAARLLAQPVSVEPFLRATDAYLDALGIRLFLVYMPLKTQVSDRYQPFLVQLSKLGSVQSTLGDAYQAQARALDRNCRDLGIPFLDLTPGLARLEASGPPLFWDYDEHMRSRGYRAAAGWILDWWNAASAADPARTH